MRDAKSCGFNKRFIFLNKYSMLNLSYVSNISTLLRKRARNFSVHFADQQQNLQIPLNILVIPKKKSKTKRKITSPSRPIKQFPSIPARSIAHIFLFLSSPPPHPTPPSSFRNPASRHYTAYPSAPVSSRAAAACCTR